MTLFELTWVPREAPLLPEVVFAHGEVAINLARRLLRLPSDRLTRLEGVFADEMLAVKGESKDLPWVHGSIYLGSDPEIPGYFLPTALCLNAMHSLIAMALQETELEMPAALVHQPPCRFSLSAARVIDPQVLQRWLDQR